VLYYRLPLKRCRSGVVRVVALAGQIYFSVLRAGILPSTKSKKATREASVTAASAPSRLFVIERTQNGLAER